MNRLSLLPIYNPGKILPPGGGNNGGGSNGIQIIPTGPTGGQILTPPGYQYPKDFPSPTGGGNSGTSTLPTTQNQDNTFLWIGLAVLAFILLN